MGVIEGGWGFVWAAYGISTAWLALYGISLVLRLRSERRRQEREASRRVVP
jgi:heme exporter protein D